MLVTINWLRSLSVGVKLFAVAFAVCVLAAVLITTTNIAALRVSAHRTP
jgi:hypothetical protein